MLKKTGNCSNHSSKAKNNNHRDIGNRHNYVNQKINSTVSSQGIRGGIANPSNNSSLGNKATVVKFVTHGDINVNR
jgi:hypothetical protein